MTNNNRRNFLKSSSILSLGALGTAASAASTHPFAPSFHQPDDSSLAAAEAAAEIVVHKNPNPGLYSLDCHREYRSILSKISKAEQKNENSVSTTIKFSTLSPKFFWKHFNRPFLAIEKLSQCIIENFAEQEDELILDALNSICQNEIRINTHIQEPNTSRTNRITSSVFSSLFDPFGVHYPDKQKSHIDLVAISRTLNSWYGSNNGHNFRYYSQCDKREKNMYGYQYKFQLYPMMHYAPSKLRRVNVKTTEPYGNTYKDHEFFIERDAIFIEKTNITGDMFYEYPSGRKDIHPINVAKKMPEEFLRKYGVHCTADAEITISIDPKKVHRIKWGLENKA